MNRRNSDVKVTYQGIGFPGILTIVLIVLKLLGKISWSWVWVLAPLWISFALGLLMFVVLIILFAIADR